MSDNDVSDAVYTAERSGRLNGSISL